MLLVDQSSRQRMGEKGRSKAITQYNWEQIADLVLEVYESLLHHLWRVNLHILFVTPVYPPVPGGTERIASALARAAG